MATKKKLLEAAAGAAGGAGLNVEEVFSTYLYTGNGTDNRAINNGIDLSGEGGMVWIKNRDFAFDHLIGDTERGITKGIRSNTTAAENNFSDRIKTVTSTGFTIGTADEINSSNTGYTGSLMDYASWTFRKAPKFFDVVTYTGTGSTQNISHNLGSVPAVVIVKRTSSAEDWLVYHRSTGNQAGTGLNETAATYTGVSAYWNSTTPTDSVFTVGTHARVNTSGQTYVAYLFAHNDGDGDFGPTGDQDIIKCGTCSGETGSNRDIDLGFEPQFIITKAVDAVGDWRLLDTMRGWLANPKVDASYLNSRLEPNTSDAESGDDTVYIKPNGFYVNGLPGSGNYIYIAIRRGPMAVPESATDVFAMDVGDGTSSPNFISNFPVDASLLGAKSGADKWYLASRLTGTEYLRPNLTNAAGSAPRYGDFDMMDAWWDGALPSDYQAWMWKRAPNYFDVVAYTGTGSARTVSHNLGVAPEMIWVKSRSNAENWQVGHKDLTGTWNRILYLNLTSAESASNAVWWNNTAPTNEVFSVGTQDMNNGSGLTYIAYLFASLNGVSKVGSFSHTNGGGDTNVDCGFNSGARFVVYKQYDSSGGWYVLDSTRGIVAGNDPALLFNSNAAQDSSYDQIDPYSSGFTIPSDGVGTGDYIFYAIA